MLLFVIGILHRLVMPISRFKNILNSITGSVQVPNGFYSSSDKQSYHDMLRILEAARYWFRIEISLMITNADSHPDKFH